MAEPSRPVGVSYVKAALLRLERHEEVAIEVQV